jgi:hypothetical protein
MLAGDKLSALTCSLTNLRPNAPASRAASSPSEKSTFLNPPSYVEERHHHLPALAPARSLASAFHRNHKIPFQFWLIPSSHVAACPSGRTPPRTPHLPGGTRWTCTAVQVLQKRVPHAQDRHGFRHKPRSKNFLSISHDQALPQSSIEHNRKPRKPRGPAHWDACLPPRSIS